MPNRERPPTVFISYCWEDDGHNRWVERFAERLRGDGVDATLDKWHLEAGDRLPLFMERVKNCDFALLVCTPAYKQKSDSRAGGVGYENDIMTSEALYMSNHRKYLPLLRKGEWLQAAPAWSLGKKYLDFRGEPYMEESYRTLLGTLFDIGIAIPPIGPQPIIQPRNKKRLDLTDLPIADPPIGDTDRR